jgi:predicted nucleotidyltransferase component of viral defense system
MMDCPQVFTVMKEGVLTLPFSSSILVVETPEEILTDKLKALYERPYLKGRDLYDLWFLHSMLGVQTHLEQLDRKLKSYVRPFRVARRATFFMKKESKNKILEAIKTDFDVFSRPPSIRFLKLQPLPRSFNPWKKFYLLLSKTDWRIY